MEGNLFIYGLVMDILTAQYLTSMEYVGDNISTWLCNEDRRLSKAPQIYEIVPSAYSGITT